MGAVMRYQPQGLVRLNRGHPLARGLVMALHPLMPGVNLADGSAISDAYGTGQSWYPVINQSGRALANNGSQNYRLSGPTNVGTTTGYTTAVLLTVRTAITSGQKLVEIVNGGGWEGGGLWLGDGTNPRFSTAVNGGTLVSTPTDYALNVPYTVVATTDATSQRIAVNGSVVGTGAISPGNLLNNGHSITLYSPSFSQRAVDVSVVLVWNRSFTAAEAAALSQNLWQLFDAGSSSSAYQAAIVSTAAATGGTGSSTGNASITLGALSRTAAGSVAVAGAQSATLAPATLTTAAGLAVNAQASTALSPATMTAAGTLGGGATLSLALAPAGIASAASLAIAAQANSALNPATLTSAAALALAAQSSTALNPATLAAAATLGGGVNLSLVLAPATASGAGSLAIGAASTRSFAPLAATTAASLAIGAQGVPSFAPATLTADGNTTVARIGSLTVTLAPATFAGSAGVTTGAQLAASLAPAGVSGTVNAALGAAFARALSPLAASGAGSLPVAAVLSGALGAATIAANGTRQLNAAFSNQLGALTLAANAGGLSGAGAVIYLGALLLAADAALTPLVFTPPPLLRALGLRYLMHRPYRKDRIVLLGKFIKQPAEREAYAIEYEDDLSVGDTLAQDQAPRVLIERTGTVTGVDATPLTLTAIDVGSTRVTLWLAAGLDGALYKITVTATTASGRILQDEFTIKIKDY